MRLRKTKSSLDDWLDRGTSPQKLWKLIFFFFARFILVFCVVHYVGIAYPQIGWVLPGPTSAEFWACCVVFTAIFTAVFYLLRRKRGGSGEGSKKDRLETVREMVEEKREVRPTAIGRASSASVVEEKREGRRGGVGRATFAPEPEAPEPELEKEQGEGQGDRRP